MSPSYTLQDSKKHLDDVIYNRCIYVVEEIARVGKAVGFLKENRLEKFGQLMYETHVGLSKKYEVSCPELDFLVALAKSEPDILGARMMGGGFGGCTLNLIHKKAVDAFVEKTAKAYMTRFGIELSHFETAPSQGTHLIHKS